MVKIVENKKTGKLYRVLNETIINKTTSNDYDVMVLYERVDELGLSDRPMKQYVREIDEFYEKFKIVVKK